MYGHHITPELQERFEYVLANHTYGRDNALTARPFCERLNIPYDDNYSNQDLNGGGRVLRELARRALLRGIPVAADTSGYFWATSPDDLNQSLRRLTSSIRTMNKRVAAIRKVQRNLRSSHAVR